MPAPVFQAAGTAQSGINALTVAWPTHLANDIGLLVVETGGEGTTLSITAPTGWATVTGSPVTDVATTAGSRLQVFWKRAASGAETSVTVPDSGDHQVARLFTFRGCVTTGNPWDVIGTGTKTTASTTVTWASVTTTVAEALCVFISTRLNDSASTTSFGAITNANLTGIGEAGEAGTTSGHGGGFVVAYGQKVTAGAIGATTATLAASTTNAQMVIALKPVIPFLARVTWAEAVYEASTPVTVPVNKGAAGASAAVASVSSPAILAAGKGAAKASAGAVGVFSATTISAGKGHAVGVGETASITQYSLRVTWAQAQYEGSPGAELSLTKGNARAAGPVGATVSIDELLELANGHARAAGPVGATVSVDELLELGKGQARAAGLQAIGPTGYAARVTWAEAKYEGTPGSALSLSVGAARATGPVGATVSIDELLELGKASAVAAGKAVNPVPGNLFIACGTGHAVGAGSDCSVLPPLTGATPGYATKHRYRVRVGTRWLEVDPLDPVSVKRAYDAAQEDAQDAATQDVEAPQVVAKQAVAVQLVGPDYDGLAKEARRISEELRKVYADALQTALIARLMRERIEQDDEDDIAVLLASI